MQSRPSLTACLGVALIAMCSSCGPHMDQQPSVYPYSRVMPNMPADSVPTTGRLHTITRQQQSAPNPLKPTPGALTNGRIYYGYYCAMCHGKAGDGNGPVGQSYDPKPTDLSSGAVRALPDGKLYYAMLTGVGHDPVMVETVPLDERWPLVLYVRQLGARPSGRGGPSPP